MPAHPLVTRSRRALWSLHAEIMRLSPAVALTSLGCLALAATSDLANTFDAPRRGVPFAASQLFLPPRQQTDGVVDDYPAHPAPPPGLDPAPPHSNPAGAFLVAIPAVWAGLPSVTLTQLLLLLLVLALAVWAAPTPLLRVVVLLLLLSTTDGVRQVAGSDFEIWPLALLLFAWLAPERRWTSAVLVGVACAIKQTAWLALPFYLIWVWRSYGRDEALRRGAAAGS